MKNFSRRCKPITNLLTRGDGPVTWTEEHVRALNDIVQAIQTGGLLLARFGEPFVLCTDFSYDGLGAVLV